MFLERLPNFKKLYEIVCLLLMKPIFTHLLISYLFCSFLVVLMHYVGQIPIIIKEVYITESRLQCLANYFLFQQLNVWFGFGLPKQNNLWTLYLNHRVWRMEATLWVKCVLVWNSQPLTSIFGFLNSNIKKMRLECRLHPSHSMISILFLTLTLTWFENLVQMFAVNCVLLPECCQSHLSSMIYHSLAQYLSENKY